MKGGAKVVVEQHRHAGVFIARGKEDALVTRNMAPGESVYGEKRISVEQEGGDKIEYRVWNPFRSKLAAAVLAGVDNIHVKPGAKVRTARVCVCVCVPPRGLRRAGPPARLPRLLPTRLERVHAARRRPGAARAGLPGFAAPPRSRAAVPALPACKPWLLAARAAGLLQPSVPVLGTPPSLQPTVRRCRACVLRRLLTRAPLPC